MVKGPTRNLCPRRIIEMSMYLAEAPTLSAVLRGLGGGGVIGGVAIGYDLTFGSGK